MARRAYPGDVSDEEWAFVASYLALDERRRPAAAALLGRGSQRLALDGQSGCALAAAPQRLACVGDCPSAKSARWLAAGVFEQIVHDLRALPRLLAGRAAKPSAGAARCAHPPEAAWNRGARARYDGHKRRKGSRGAPGPWTRSVHLLAAHVSAASEQERAQVGQLAAEVQQSTGQNIALACVDQGYTGEEPLEAAQAQGIRS